MGNFLKITGIMVSSIFAFLLFVMFVRMKFTDEPFLSIESIATHVSSYDVWKPWNEFLEFEEGWRDDFSKDWLKNEEYFNAIAWEEPNYVKVNNPLDLGKNIGSWFSALFNVFGQFFNAIRSVIVGLAKTIGNTFTAIGRLAISILKFLGYIIWMCFDFIKFIFFA